MRNSEAFEFGVFVGLVIGLCFTFIVGRFLDKQIDYWRDGYCVAAYRDEPEPPSFCTDRLTEYAEFMSVIWNREKDNTND